MCAYRPAIEMRELTRSQLLTSVMDSMDLAGIATQFLKFDTDLSESDLLLKQVQAYLKKGLLPLAMYTAELAKKSGYHITKTALETLPDYMKWILTNSRLQALQSMGGLTATTTLKRQEIKLYSAFNNVDLLASVLFDIPASIAKRKATKWWFSALAPDPLSERDFFNLTINGLKKTEDFIERYRFEDGISEEDARLVANLRRFQWGMPSLRDAWSMVKKGLKPQKFFFDLVQLGQGWSKENAKALFDFYDYDPSVSELLRLTDLIPLEPAWIDRKLTAQGLNAEDKLIFKSALEKRAIRDEVNKAWSLLLDSYSWGLFTTTQVTDLLTNWKFGKEEIQIRTQTAELIKLKLRVKLMRDAEIYLYRKDVLTEASLYLRLLNLNITKDIANAIVRNEASKRGIDWEIASEGMRTLTISVNNSEFGSTMPSVGQHQYEVGAEVTIYGVPVGEHFVSYWLLDGVVYGVAEPSIVVDMSTGHTVVCVFDEEPPEE